MNLISTSENAKVTALGIIKLANNKTLKFT
jgi:hypothetical protein